MANLTFYHKKTTVPSGDTDVGHTILCRQTRYENNVGELQWGLYWVVFQTIFFIDLHAQMWKSRPIHAIQF